MNQTWLEISTAAIKSNLNAFRQLVDKNIFLAPAVKANAYGHGIVECAQLLEKSGADFLCVNALYEAEKLRLKGIKIPILIIGYTPLSDLKKAIDLNCDLTVYNLETIKAIIDLKKTSNLHLKIETGNHRQGVFLEDVDKTLTLIQSSKYLNLVGVSTHFANIEDRINHEYALKQLKVFKRAIKMIEEKGIKLKYKHCANSAASLVLPESHFNFVRPGISIYGMWPSKKTKIATRRFDLKIQLKPAMTWKTCIAQVKEVQKGALIGYGCTYKMPKKGLIAVLPVGYYDSYTRLLSNKAEVLIKGKRAPVVGRVCMNMIMVNVSHIPNIKLEEEVVLFGKQDKEEITAEQMGKWSKTINYEVTTRIPEHVPRIFVD